MAYPSSASGYASNTAISASGFVNSIGVNTHLTYTDTVYGNVQAVGDALSWLGVDLVRDYLPSWLTGPYNQLAGRGVDFDFFFPGQGDLSSYVGTLTAFATQHPGAIAAIEGPNEVNYWPVTYNGQTGLAAQAMFQSAFFAALNANPVLSEIPVYNLTLGGAGSSTFALLGNMLGSADYANVHMYFGAGGPPSAYWSYAVGLGQIAMPGTGTVITEAGYSTAYNNAEGVDELTQAKYMLDLLMDSAKAGAPSIYLYELVDERNDAARTSKEDNFGLFHNDWTPKIAANAIHNLTAILTDDAGPATTPATLAYNVSGLPANGGQMLFQEGDGTLDIVLWAEPDIWNEATRQPIAAAGQQVTITLPAPVAGYSVYDPLSGTSPILTGGATSQITVTVTDHPLIIELAPDGVAGAAYDWAGYAAGGMSTYGGAANDTLAGAGATDMLRGGDGADSLSGGGAFDDLNGNAGNDTVYGGADGDWVVGGKDNDLLEGEDGGDIVYGNLGADTVNGGAGNDTVRGGQGDDTVSGGAGNDWICGDKGVDVLSGGAGADIFHVFAGSGVDQVIDFSSAQGDRVQLLPGAAYHVVYSGGDTIIDLGGGDQLVLVGVTQGALGDWLVA